MDQMQYQSTYYDRTEGENPPYWRMQQPYVTNGANYVGRLKGVCFDPILGHYRHGHLLERLGLSWAQRRWRRQSRWMARPTMCIWTAGGSGSCLWIRRGGQHERADAAGGAAGPDPARYLAAAVRHWAEDPSPAGGSRLVGGWAGDLPDPRREGHPRRGGDSGAQDRHAVSRGGGHRDRDDGDLSGLRGRDGAALRGIGPARTVRDPGHRRR